MGGRYNVCFLTTQHQFMYLGFHKAISSFVDGIVHTAAICVCVFVLSAAL